MKYWQLMMAVRTNPPPRMLIQLLLQTCCGAELPNRSRAENRGWQSYLYLQQWTGTGTLTWCIIKNMTLRIHPKVLLLNTNALLF